MRTATWNKVGFDIREATNVDEAMKIAGLDYEVVKAPVYLSSKARVPGVMATKIKGTNEVFGIVGENYNVVQNRDAFAFVDSIVSEGLEFCKAGQNKYFVYLIASLPKTKVLGDDVQPYIIFQNSHNGTSTVRAAICPLRIVCENQFNFAFREADNKVSLRHSARVMDKLNDAQDVLRMNAGYMNEFAKKAEDMALIKLSDIKVNSIIEEYFKIPENATERKINSIEESRTLFLSAYNAEDNQNFKGTAWGMVNAFSDYVTHVTPKRKTDKADDSRFMYVTFNPHLFTKFVNMVEG